MADKSAIFTAYNTLRNIPGVDHKRLNRGLGVALRRLEPEYETTLSSCSCPDHVYRPWTICKHQLALILKGAI